MIKLKKRLLAELHEKKAIDFLGQIVFEIVIYKRSKCCLLVN